MTELTNIADRYRLHLSRLSKFNTRKDYTMRFNVFLSWCYMERYQYQNPSNRYNGNETSGSDNHTNLDRDEAIRKVCMLNSVYFIGGGAESGFGRARMNASNDYNVDQIHHTNLGGYNFAQAIWSKLKNIPLFYTAIPS